MLKILTNRQTGINFVSKCILSISLASESVINRFQFRQLLTTYFIKSSPEKKTTEMFDYNPQQ